MSDDKEIIKKSVFDAGRAGFEQMQEITNSIHETNRAIGLISQSIMNPILDSMRSQISVMYENSKLLQENIQQGLLCTQVLKLVEPVVKLGAIYSAQLNAITSITKIEYPLFDLPTLVLRRRKSVHQSLEKELRILNKEYYKMWDGSWKAINSDNPDKIRQSAISMRELFRTLLHDYSDEKQIMNEYKLVRTKDITRRQRLFFILKDSGVKEEEIDQLDETISVALELDQKMHKAAHSSEEEKTFRNLLYLYEGFVWMIIKQKLATPC